MQLPSHFLITAFIDQHVSEKHVRKHTLAFLLGSVLPDFPFAVLTLLYSAYYKWFGSLPPNSTSNVMEYLHFELFFRDPVCSFSEIRSGLLDTIRFIRWS